MYIRNVKGRNVTLFQLSAIPAPLHRLGLQCLLKDRKQLNM